MSREESRHSEEQKGQLDQEGEGAEKVTVGVQLRQLRGSKGLTIRDIARETNISASNLVAIEHEDYETLPANTFVRGQVMLYGNFLGLDGAEAARRFLQERNQQQAGKKKDRFWQHNDTLSPKELAEPAHVSPASLAALLLLIIIFCTTAFCWYTGWQPFAYLMNRNQEQPVFVPSSEDVSESGTEESGTTTQDNGATSWDAEE